MRLSRGPGPWGKGTLVSLDRVRGIAVVDFSGKKWTVSDMRVIVAADDEPHIFPPVTVSLDDL